MKVHCWIIMKVHCWIILIAALHWLAVSSGALVDAPETYTAARTSCQLQGGVLPSYRDENVFIQIENDLNKMNKSQVRLWTSVTVEHLPGFIWLNGHKADVKQTSPYECGHLDTTTRNISTSDCSIGRHGLICQFMTVAGVTCDSRCETINRVACISIDGTCYVAWCPQRGKEKTWLAAQKECRAQDGHLAQLMLPGPRQQLSRQLRDQQGSDCREYSIGFRNFRLLDSNTRDEIPPEKLEWDRHWSDDSPQCMTVTVKVAEKALWTPTSCIETHSFLCTESASLKTGSGNKNEGMHPGIVAAIVLGTILIVTPFIIIIIYKCRKERKTGRTCRTVNKKDNLTSLNMASTSSRQEMKLLANNPKERQKGRVSETIKIYEDIEAKKNEPKEKPSEPLTELKKRGQNLDGNDCMGPLLQTEPEYPM